MNTVRLYNSGPQTIPLQLRPPKGDFYLGEQQIHLAAGKEVSVPGTHLNKSQIENLQARGTIRILSGQLPD